MVTMDVVIITRHNGAVEWLRRMGITGEVIAHATEDDVRGRHVVGAVPMHLAAIAASVTTIDMPNLSADLRGVDLTPEQMDEAGAVLRTYAVVRTFTPMFESVWAAAQQLADEGTAMDEQDALGWYLGFPTGDLAFPAPWDVTAMRDRGAVAIMQEEYKRHQDALRALSLHAIDRYRE